MQNRKRDTDVQNSLLDSVGEGEDGMFQENNIEKKKERTTSKRILSRVKQITSPGWMHETSGSDLVHWEDLEGSGGEGGGRDWDGEHM